MYDQQFNNGISPNPFERLSEADLTFLLEHNKEQLTEAQVLDIQARLNRFQKEEELGKTMQMGKVYTLTPPKKNNKAGYVDIIILMLVTWVTCLLGMFYLYSNIMG